MANGRPNLRVVDEHGEVHGACPGCARLEDEVKGLQRDIRGWATRYANLARDKEQDAREHPSWEEVGKLFDYWRETCRHGRSRLNAERFWLALPYVQKDGIAMCRKAIDGAAFDPFCTTQKNGATKKHDGFDLIFRDRGHFESFANRAPRTPTPDELYSLANRILERMPEDDRPTEDRVFEAVQRAQEQLREAQR